MKMPRRLSRLRDEDGVTAVIVAVSLIAIFGSAVMSVDAGSVWRARRALITDTDAAALAAARYLDANGRSACTEGVTSGPSSAAGNEARTVLEANDVRDTLENLVVSPYQGDCDRDSGHVRVDARHPIQLHFAGVFGFNNLTAFSSSAAQYGPLTTTTGLRPIAICDKLPHFAEWAAHVNGDDSSWGVGADHPGYAGAVVHRIYFQRGSSGCGSASGNWDWLDFNETTNPNGNSALRDWLLNGYAGRISIGDEATGIPPDCNPEKDGSDACAPKTGAGGGSFTEALGWLRDNNVVFPIIVYDRVVDKRDPQGCDSADWSGSGENARYCPVAFLLVRIKGWDKVTGAISDNSYFDFEFVDEWWVGQIGGDPAEGRPTTHGVQLCGTNYGTTIDTRCDV